MRILALLALSLMLAPAASYGADNALGQAVSGDHRAQNRANRDAHRHPQETLEFFGIRSNMNVVEIWPGAGGFYSEILAPYLRDSGKLYAADFGPEPQAPGRLAQAMKGWNQQYKDKLAAAPDLYDQVSVTHLQVGSNLEIAPAGSVDMVVTFRNVHNWLAWDQSEDILAKIHQSLKTGGILGVTDHRADPAVDEDPNARNGYVHQAQAIRLIEKAGFKLVATSEINSNAKDSKNHPSGVWTLPPTYARGDEDHDKYAAIGESDRFTLKFVKQ